jgi:hypothetical protein
MTTPNFTWTCFHCGQVCGDTAGGYGAITDQKGILHASCSPANPSQRPDCYRRVTEFSEPPGALVDVEPKPVGVEDIRSPSTAR